MKTNTIIDAIAESIKQGKPVVLVKVPEGKTIKQYQDYIRNRARVRHYDWHILDGRYPSGDTIIIKPYRTR